MRIREILQTKGSAVITITPDASVRDLVVLLKEHNLGAVVVSTDGAALDGIVSERDIVRALAVDAAVLSASVSDVMTAGVRTCQLNDSVESLMSTMTDHRIRHLPVVDDDGNLSGIISIGEVVKSTITQLEFGRDQWQGSVSG